MTDIIFPVKADLEQTMRVSRQQADENRSRVLESASKLFREHGLAGVGVADIMGAAGLTHGGFYKQFGSKDDLAAEACELALERARSARRSPRVFRTRAPPQLPAVRARPIVLAMGALVGALRSLRLDLPPRGRRRGRQFWA